MDYFWYDYLTLGLILLCSCGIGIYFGWISRRKDQTVQEYLQGGKQMSSLPVGLSVAIGHISGGVLILVPVEIYKYGAVLIWIVPVFFINAIIVIYVFAPILFKAEVASIFEYLEKRFDTKTKLLAASFYIIQETIMLAFINSTSAVILGTNTGINPFVLSIICTLICLFYTAIGGLRAVIWSDIFQLLLILVSYFTILYVGLQSVGGIESMFSTAYRGHRLDIFDFDPDPTKRDSFWIIVFGLGSQQIYHKMMDQAAVQKFLSVPHFRDCIKSVLYSTVCVALLYAIVVLAGLILYAKYHTCDPLSINNGVKFNQLLSHFVLNLAEDKPGMWGLFVGGIICAGLSSISSILNALSGVIYKDFVCKFSKKQFSTTTAKQILKSVVVIEGLLSIGISYGFQKANEIFQIAITMLGLTVGPMLGLMILSVLYPKANAQGAFYSASSSFIAVGIVSLMSIYYQNKGLLMYPSKPLNTTGCSANFSLNFENYENNKNIPFIFKISHFYTSTMVAVLTIVLGILISWICSKHSKPVDKTLLYQKRVYSSQYAVIEPVTTII